MLTVSIALTEVQSDSIFVWLTSLHHGVQGLIMQKGGTSKQVIEDAY